MADRLFPRRLGVSLSTVESCCRRAAPTGFNPAISVSTTATRPTRLLPLSLRDARGRLFALGDQQLVMGCIGTVADRLRGLPSAAAADHPGSKVVVTTTATAPKRPSGAEQDELAIAKATARRHAGRGREVHVGARRRAVVPHQQGSSPPGPDSQTRPGAPLPSVAMPGRFAKRAGKRARAS